MFGKEARDVLFRNFFAEERGRARLHLTPPTDDRIVVAVDIHEKAAMLKDAAIGVSFADQLPSGQLAEACLTAAADEPLTVRGTLVDTEMGLAAYARVPLSDSLGRRVGGVEPGPDSSLYRSLRPSLTVGRASNGRHVAAGGMSSMPAKDSLYAPAPAAAAGESPGAPVRLPDWAEAGAVWSNDTLATGVHVGAGPGKPVKAWGMLRGSGASVGVQASAFVADLAGEVGKAAPGAVAEALRAASGRVDVDAGVSVSSPGLYDASLVLRGATSELVLSYMHHMTMRRRVRNILEEAHVKGIFNYVDVGLEYRQPLVRGEPYAVTVAASWQLNQHLMLKARAGTEGAAASVAARTWAHPSLTATASAGVAPAAGESLLTSSGLPFVGFSLGFGNAAPRATYRNITREEAPQPGYRQVVADPTLSPSRSSSVEASVVSSGPTVRRRPSAMSSGAYDESGSLLPRPPGPRA